MLRSLLLTFALLPSIVLAQLQSDTTTLWLENQDGLRVVNAYFGGGLLRTKDGKSWRQEGLFVGGDKVHTIERNSTDKNPYSFSPTGLLRINESVIFMVGVRGTFDYVGIIARSVDNGQNWTGKELPENNSWLTPKDLFFITESIGIAFFGDVHESPQYAITFDQGTHWEFNKTDKNRVTHRHQSIRLDLRIDRQKDLIRDLSGRYSLDGGKSWIDIGTAKSK